jgi:hypothetical protein
MPIVRVEPGLKMAQPTVSVLQTAGTPEAGAWVTTGALVATAAGAAVAGAAVAGAEVAGAAVAGAAVAGAAVAGAAVAGAAVGVAPQAARSMLAARTTERTKIRRFMDYSSKGLV